MIRIHSTALCASVLMALTACGGGDDAANNSATPSPTLTGLAATGAAIANAPVTARCVAGDPLSGTTDGNGVFTLTLSATHTAPCMLEVVNGTSKLYSFATAAGRVNITPATDLVLAYALKDSPEAAFKDFKKTKSDSLLANLADAKAYVKEQLLIVTGVEYKGDPITDALAVDDPDDKVLDELGKALETNDTTFAALRAVASEGADLSTILPEDTGTGGGGTGGDTCPTTATTLPYVATTAGGPFTNGQQVCVTASATALTVASTTLTQPTQNTAVTAPYAAYKFVGSSAAFEVVFNNGVLHEINVLSVDASIFYGQLAAEAANGGDGGTTPPAATSFFGSNKTAADVAFLNGQSFTGTNCSVSFANGTMTVIDTANNRTASASFSGDALDRIVPANGRAQIDFEFSDDMQLISGRTYPATGKPSAAGKFQIADYVNAQATVLEATVTRHDGAGNAVSAACRNINQPLTSWVRPSLSSGSLNLVGAYTTDINRHIALETDVPKLVGTYTGLSTAGTYKKVQLKPSISVLENLTSQSCALTVNAQGQATLTVAGKTHTDSLVGEWLLFHGGSMLSISSAPTEVEYVKGYQFGQVNADLYITWADAAQYQGPVGVELKATASDNSFREEISCQFK